MTSLYQQQNADTFTDIGISTAHTYTRPVHDLSPEQKQLARERMDRLKSPDMPLYGYTGKAWYLK